MADTFTTNLNLTKPEVGASTDTWGGKLNDDLDDIDALFSSTGTSVAMNLDGAVIDSSVIGGTTPAAGSFTTLSASTSITGTLATAAQTNITSVGTLTGLTVTGEITANGGIALGDSDQATFGDSDDLAIYHDGSNSYVRDTGTGDLRIQATNLRIEATSGEDYLYCASDGAVTVYYDNAAKLATTAAGITVTGTVTSDGLTVDGNAELVGNALSLDLMESDQTDKNLRLRANGGVFSVQTLSDDKATQTNRLQISHTTGDVSFYEDTGTTQQFYWDASAESLGIGTTSPSFPLHISSTGTVLGLNSTSGAVYQRFNENGTARFFLSTLNGSNGIAFVNGDGVSERMRIDSSGRLLVNTTSSVAAGYIGAIRCATGTGGFIIQNSNTTGVPLSFRNSSGTEVGYVSTTNTATTYNTSSDYRLKNIKGSIQNGLERVQQLNPVQFDWKESGETSEGFIAHEVQEIFSDAVSGEKDGKDMQSMDYGRITPLLVKAIQEQQVLIEQLQAEVALLKGE